MKRSIPLLSLAMLVLSLATLACAPLSFQRIGLKDLPVTPFEATVYTSGTKGLAIILDVPGDGIVMTVTEKYRTKQEGLKTPQGYLKDFIWTPKAYRVQDRRDRNVLGYLLISPELEWLIDYNKGRQEINIWIEDPYDADRRENRGF